MSLFNLKNNKTKKIENSGFVNPEVLEVNLIKDEMEVDFEWNKRMLSLFLPLFVAALFVAEIYFGLDWWQKQEEQKAVSLKNDYETVSQSVKNIKAQAEEVMIFKDKLVVSQKMIDNHIYWTNFFTWLEKNTLNSVSYGGSFSGDISGSYSLSATTRNYRDISWQVKQFRTDKYVSFVDVSDGASGSGGDKNAETEKKVNETPPVSFNLELKVKPEIFYR
ncbi:MAG: hypothetical protein WAW11_00600 [Patescibacteria group bacterium]